MAVFYLDASAIVKRYRSERGTEVIDELLNRSAVADRFYCSYLAVLEVTSAVLRLASGGQLSRTTVDRMLAQFSSDVANLIQLWPLDNEIVAGAIGVVSHDLLRSADAIHLATAMRVAELTEETATVMVTSDRELLVAAERSRLVTLNPEALDATEVLIKVRAQG